MTKLPQTPSFRLDGKRALVTGASSGLGLGAATALAEAGAEVTMVARHAGRLEEAASALEATGGKATALSLDITRLEETNRMVERHGPFEILVNSAGMARHCPALDVTPEIFDEVMNLNLRASYFLTIAIARGLIEAGCPGSLINFSSQMGLTGATDRAVYCASKHAVEGFTKVMAIEFGSYRIRVNTICPTFVRTPLTEATFNRPDEMRRIRQKIKLGRHGEIEDVMGAVVYLASDASALVTGTALRVDGGWTAG